jgi:hypothetical protein
MRDKDGWERECAVRALRPFGVRRRQRTEPLGLFFLWFYVLARSLRKREVWICETVATRLRVDVVIDPTHGAVPPMSDSWLGFH